MISSDTTGSAASATTMGTVSSPAAPSRRLPAGHVRIDVVTERPDPSGPALSSGLAVTFGAGRHPRGVRGQTYP